MSPEMGKESHVKYNFTKNKQRGLRACILVTRTLYFKIYLSSKKHTPNTHSSLVNFNRVANKKKFKTLNFNRMRFRRSY
jgi:hypothetical protein